jgi:prepilin-type N-terminal cleavage/methylation domain-containing protein/prepilin-type processing-associated H-X9-DG protein
VQSNRQRRRLAFTLIELLVVIAIIALLISVLLPSLSSAREKARAAKCGVQLKNLGTGLATYFTEYDGWIPGVNTSGVVTSWARGSVDALRRPSTPVQTFDWLSPILRYVTELGETRAKRWQTLINDLGCPSFTGLTIDELYPPGGTGVPDFADFNADILDSFAPLSYLMPAHFQQWGHGFGESYVIGHRMTGRPICAKIAYDWYSVRHMGLYISRLDNVGPPARKIAAADGTRFLDASGVLDFDITPDPTYFGSCTSNGAWWAGSQAYGVMAGTANWDGTTVNVGSDSDGKSLLLSYRHGSGGASVPQGVRDNNGSINAMFFDGHVARLDDRASRNIEFWYPTGAEAGDGALDGLTDVPNGYQVP